MFAGRLVVSLMLVPALALVASCGSDSAVAPDAAPPDPDASTETDATPPPAAPTGVTASDGTSSEVVTVTWSGVADATDYRVWRDGAPIATVAAAATTHDDDGATAALVPPVPTNVRATQDLLDRITVSWTFVVPPSGAVHTYTVTARNDAGE